MHAKRYHVCKYLIIFTRSIIIHFTSSFNRYFVYFENCSVYVLVYFRRRSLSLRQFTLIIAIIIVNKAFPCRCCFIFFVHIQTLLKASNNNTHFLFRFCYSYKNLTQKLIKSNKQRTELVF